MQLTLHAKMPAEMTRCKPRRMFHPLTSYMMSPF
jgi:hypothetical protein